MVRPAPSAACAVVLIAAVLALSACRPTEGPAPQGAPGAEAAADAWGHTPPTADTVAANRALADTLPLDDPADFEDAERGLVARAPEVVIPRDSGDGLVWDTRSYAFIEGDAPASVNPSLWRQARLNDLHGLYRVTDGVYQVRGYDLSNMTVIEGTSGLIVVDPLTSVETARAALAFAREHLGDRPVSAVVITHSHVDHFGGIRGVLPAQGEAGAAIPIVAPAGFVEEATSENVIAGTVMSRRATYMYGMPLARTPRGHVDSGLGKEPAIGGVSTDRPTAFVDHTPQEMVLDGVRFVFQYAPESEAPAELTFYLPDRKAFCAAEIATHNMHNLYTLRGAKVRDALRWSGYLDEALRLFPEAEVVFASHHWPVWGRERVAEHLRRQRDTYRYIHDQTLRLASLGRTPGEIAEELTLPEPLRSTFASRGYYGTVRHNARAVYQHYFGWYDGNPAHLDPLPHEDAAKRYVEAMGGPDAVRDRAADAFARGEYRWAATLLDHLVFARPDDEAARELLARTYDQLGYRAESGPWRDEYLTAAHELRHGISPRRATVAGSMDLLLRVPLEQFFTAMATRVVGPKAAGRHMVVNFVFTDLGESHVLTLENAVLHHHRRDPAPDADITLRLTHPFFLRLVTRQAGLRDLIFSDELDVDGSRRALLSFFSLLEPPDETFAIVTP